MLSIRIGARICDHLFWCIKATKAIYYNEDGVVELYNTHTNTYLRKVDSIIGWK